MTPASADFRQTLPFDSHHLDALMADAGIEILLVTSKHNIQYLLGGYRYFFCDYSDALGVSRYLPILLYPRGRPEDATYIGQTMERFEVENGRFWTPTTDTTTWQSVQAMQVAVERVKALGITGRVGIERAFVPADAADLLRAACPNLEVVEGHFPLERLRAVKMPKELALIAQASERVVESMLATFGRLEPGMTKNDVVKTLRQQELDRDLVFEYCLISAGSSLNRAPSDQILAPGDILTLDSGGCYRGYMGDLCRMGIIGTPDAELVELLAEVDAIQQAVRAPIKAGGCGSEIYAIADALVNASPRRDIIHFVAHGMGIIGHEAPRLSGRGPVTYEGCDWDTPLQPGMVLSIETTMGHPRRGLIKLEDTLAVTQDGFVAYGDHGRGWNRAPA